MELLILCSLFTKIVSTEAVLTIKRSQPINIYFLTLPFFGQVELDKSGHWASPDEGNFKKLYTKYHTRVGNQIRSAC